MATGFVSTGVKDDQPAIRALDAIVLITVPRYWHLHGSHLDFNPQFLVLQNILGMLGNVGKMSLGFLDVPRMSSHREGCTEWPYSVFHFFIQVKKLSELGIVIQVHFFPFTKVTQICHLQ